MKLIIKLPDCHNVEMLAAGRVIRGQIVYYDSKPKGGAVV